MKTEIISMPVFNFLGHFQTWSECLSSVTGLFLQLHPISVLKNIVLYTVF